MVDADQGDFSPENLARIKALPADQRRKELQALKDSLNAVLTTYSTTALPPMTADAYLSRLAGLDLSSAAALADFVADTQTRRVELVPLGVHKGVSYVLQSGMETVPKTLVNLSQLPGPDSARGLSGVVCAYDRVSIPGASVPGAATLRFGFGLGKLQHYAAAADASTGDMVLMDSGYFVIVDVLDRSIWVSIDWFPLDENGVPQERGSDGDLDWGQLPGDNAAGFGVTKISQAAWEKSQPLSIAAGDPFVGGPRFGCRLVAKPAGLKELQEAMMKKQRAAA